MAKVTIIGSGIAAITAAIEAHQRGAQIRLVRGRPGATALSSGTWDLAGHPSRHAGLHWDEYPSPRQNIHELVRRFPDHPYAVIAQNREITDVANFLKETVDQISLALDLKLRGSMDSPLALINPLGGIKMTSFAPQNHFAGNLASLKQASLLIVGILGLPQYPAEAIHHILRKVLPQTKSVMLPLPTSPFSPIPLASQFENDAFAESFCQLLLKEVKKNPITHVMLPPVIGLEKNHHILSHLRETSGLEYFECLGLPPSVPGLRLQKKIDQFLASQKSWEIVEGEGIQVSSAQRKIRSIMVQNGEQKQEMNTDRLILATGRYISGGIVKEKAFREPLLNLPLFSEGKVVEEVFVGKMLAERFMAKHPLFSVGIRTNHLLQPLDEKNDTLYENLWAAGSIIGGQDAAMQHCGMGVASGTGRLAGRMASL